MSNRGLILLALVVLALLVGYGVGYRARISEEVVKVYPYPMLPPIPDELATVQYDPRLWPDGVRWN